MCTRPLKGFVAGKRENGKKRIYIRNYKVDHLEIMPNDHIISVYSDDVNYNNKPVREFVEIPCGKCLECKLNHSRQWAERCFLESLDHEKNAFITLTYNDFCIPLVNDVNPVTGELNEFKTLRKTDFQLFMKRFRKELSKKGIEVRFYAAGEYGETTKRPHYHAIIFGWYPDEEDLQIVGKNALGDTYYSSSLLSKVWPFGNNIVAECTYSSCSYVARYVTKKVDVIKSNKFREMNIEKEFTLMSRMPGIGLKWFDNNIVCYANFINNYIPTKKGSQKISSNRYFDSKLEQIDPVKLKEIKEVRQKFVEERNKLMMSTTSLPYLDALQVREENLKAKTKILSRKEV